MRFLDETWRIGIKVDPAWLMHQKAEWKPSRLVLRFLQGIEQCLRINHRGESECIDRILHLTITMPYAPANATISASMRSVCVYGKPCAAFSYTNNRSFPRGERGSSRVS
jgi:hypothetical protein